MKVFISDMGCQHLLDNNGNFKPIEECEESDTDLRYFLSLVDASDFIQEQMGSKVYLSTYIFPVTTFRVSRDTKGYYHVSNGSQVRNLAEVHGLMCLHFDDYTDPQERVISLAGKLLGELLNEGEENETTRLLREALQNVNVIRYS